MASEPLLRVRGGLLWPSHGYVGWPFLGITVGDGVVRVTGLRRTLHEVHPADVEEVRIVHGAVVRPTVWFAGPQSSLRRRLVVAPVTDERWREVLDRAGFEVSPDAWPRDRFTRNVG